MITRKRKLRTDGSLWQHLRAPRVPRGALARGTRADVLIVGAGITGAMIGEALSEAGLDVMIVDRRGPVEGSTVASTALVAYELDVPLVELQRKIGKRNATRAWQRARLAVASLQAFLRERGLDAQSRDSLYLAGTSLGARALLREAALRRAAGIETEYLDRAQLRARFGIARSAALLSFDHLAINPRAITAQLLIRAQRHGARVYAPVQVDELSRTKSSIVAQDRNGRRIRCKHVVFATGYEFPKFVPLAGHRVTTTFALATAPQPRKLWPGACLIWEASSPYLYVRATPEGRVLCGGEDERTSQRPHHGQLLERKIARLQGKLAKLFPDLDTTPEFTWSASFGETATGLPIIGEIPGWKNCWAALGYGGNGITYSRIAAELVRAALTGETDPDVDLYAFEH